MLSLGSQDAFLTSQPKQTHFVSVFHRNTPFLLNTVLVPFNGLSRFGERTICKIPQTGDVILGMSLQSNLPRLGTPSNVYTYVGPLKHTFSVLVNGNSVNVKFPINANTGNLSWLKIPGLTFDDKLNITSTTDSSSVGFVPGPVGGIVTYNSSTDTGIQFTSSDTGVVGFGSLVTLSDDAPGLQYNGYSGTFPKSGFLSRDLKYRMFVPTGKPDQFLQPDVPSNQVYGRHWTFTFQTAKSFTQVRLVIPPSTSVLSRAQIPGWTYVFGSNDGTNWTLLGPPQNGSSIINLTNSSSSWLSYRVLVASAETSSFLVSCILLQKPSVTVFDCSDSGVSDFFCLESNVITINGTYETDIPISQSPVWSYTTERNISYKSESGNLIIKNSSIRLGGQTINEIPGEYLCLDQDLSVPDENQIGLTALTGKNDTQRVTETKTYLSKIPYFEFLPSCSLLNHDIEVEVELEQFSNLLAYKGLGIIDPTSQSIIQSNIDISTNTRPLFDGSNTLISTSTNIVSFNTQTFSIEYTGVNGGTLVDLSGEIYAYDGSRLKNANTLDYTEITGSVVGSDKLSTLYVFNQTSNIFTSFDSNLNYSNSFVRNQTLVLPPGYVTATVEYIDTNQARYRSVDVPFTIRSQVTDNSSSLAQIYIDNIGDYYANAIVPWVTNFTWNSDYNANCYYSISHTNQPQLGQIITSNTSALASSDAPFVWKTNGFLFPGTYNLAVSYHSSTSIGRAELYYTGPFQESFKYESIDDPYNSVVDDPWLRASFVYTKSTNGSWKTLTTSNLNSLTVYRGIQSQQSRCANVLVGYQSIRFIGTVPSGSNAVVTYFNYDGNKVTTNVFSDNTIIDPTSTYETPEGMIETLTGTTTCRFIGSEIVFFGPMPIYSVVVNGVSLAHRSLPGLVNPRQFPLGSTVNVEGTTVTVTNRTEWVSDRILLQNGIFYGPGKINGVSETYGSTSDLKTLMDQGLVVLSDSTPWQSRYNTDIVYYTGTTWSLSKNIWPDELSVTFYDSKNTPTAISAPRNTFEQTLVNSGYGTISRLSNPNGIWTLQNAVFATCYDIRTRYILGIGENQVVPIRYYQDPKVLLSVGGLPNYPFERPIEDVSIITCTDSNSRIYTGSTSNTYFIQVTGNVVAAFDYTGNFTPNRVISPVHESFFTSVTDGTMVYWVSRNGNVMSYDSTFEFGTDGSIIKCCSLVTPNVHDAIATSQYLVLSTSSTESLFFIEKANTSNITEVSIDRSSGILSWDGSRYLSVFSSNSVLQIDTIQYSPPDNIPLNMMIEYAILSVPERDHFISSTNDQLFKQIQSEEFVIRAGIQEEQFEVHFKNLVSELFFTLSGNPLDDFEAISMTFNGYPVFDYDDAGTELALSKIQPYEHHTRIPDRPFWMFSFAKYPERMNPSGFVNMSRIKDQVVSVRVNPSNEDRVFKIWATSYNVVRFKDGLCGLLY